MSFLHVVVDQFTGQLILRQHFCDSILRSLQLRRSWAVFDAMEGRGTVMFRPDDHLARLFESCRGASIPTVSLPTASEIKKLLTRLLVQDRNKESLISTFISRGTTQNGKTPSGFPEMILEVQPLVKTKNKALKLITICARRDFPRVKLVGEYGKSALYCLQAEEKGFDGFLFRDPVEGITEEPYANIFFITKKNELVTPAEGKVLSGITRKVVLEIARGAESLFSDVRELPYIHPHSLKEYQEVFLTSTTRLIAPVKLIEEHKFKIGPRTQTAALQRLFYEYREKYFSERGAK
ncbi:aminotransferase class IV family protein [Candidatus Giovannonibacteria bacterium]|nr:aminotransferase class IV family protein [Candidatus Giovannonibacteria bacterium]